MGLNISIKEISEHHEIYYCTASLTFNLIFFVLYLFSDYLYRNDACRTKDTKTWWFGVYLYTIGYFALFASYSINLITLHHRHNVFLQHEKFNYINNNNASANANAIAMDENLFKFIIKETNMINVNITSCLDLLGSVLFTLGSICYILPSLNYKKGDGKLHKYINFLKLLNVASYVCKQYYVSCNCTVMYVLACIKTKHINI